jgi:hypothetical protein
MSGLGRFLVYSGFGLDRFYCITMTKCLSVVKEGLQS